MLDQSTIANVELETNQAIDSISPLLKNNLFSVTIIEPIGLSSDEKFKHHTIEII